MNVRLTFTAGTRVRVKPGSVSAALVGKHPLTGTVRAFEDDDKGPVVVVELDDGALVSSLSPSDWTVLPAESEGR